jgi:H+-translocating NAD(P) transhydrogenase subunit alpha
MASILVPCERAPGETRVAATPETVKRMVKAGLTVRVEEGAGVGAFIDDASFTEAGASMVSGADLETAWKETDVVLVVGPLHEAEARRLKSGAVAVGLFAPHGHLETVGAFVEGGITSLSMELVPRITRAQKMDALSSQASIAGYKAVLIAASHLPKYFPLLMTAAGTVKPARVVIMGAGVAGLQAVATAKRLGAVVEVSDIRAEVEEQVQSLGAKFIPLPDMQEGGAAGGYAQQVTPEFLAKQREIVAEHIAAADVVITTALVPGRPAPKLVSKEMVESMRRGSVIVDLAVAAGGNCELSVAGEDVDHGGVRIVGHPNLPATVPVDASSLYARNVLELLMTLVKEGRVEVDVADEVVAGALLTHGGEVSNAAIAELIGKDVGAKAAGKGGADT